MSDYMSTPEYMINIIDRAGALGPWTMVKSIFDGFDRGDNPFVSQIPFIDMIDQTIFEQPIFPDIDVSKDNGSKQDK